MSDKGVKENRSIGGKLITLGAIFAAVTTGNLFLGVLEGVEYTIGGYSASAVLVVFGIMSLLEAKGYEDSGSDQPGTLDKGPDNPAQD